MNLTKAIKLAIENGWEPYQKAQFYCMNLGEGFYGNVQIGDHFVLDRDFWQALAVGMNWEQKIEKDGICLHCGIDCQYQPTKESGCNHAHYPEACKICSEKRITWQEHWHSLIDALASGKSVEEFFENNL